MWRCHTRGGKTHREESGRWASGAAALGERAEDLCVDTVAERRQVEGQARVGHDATSRDQPLAIAMLVDRVETRVHRHGTFGRHLWATARGSWG